MVKVEMELMDSAEVQGFNQLVQKIEEYRAMKTSPVAAPAQPTAAAPAAVITPDDVSDAQYGRPVVAAITPEGAVKPPKEADMIKASQEYIKVHGIDKALELVRRYGVAKITELKDPVKLALLYGELKAGLE